uniref:Apple domain-containing protein n=1 Tax=Panagrolaimus sp. ES5 TaxID=591445 RepID=A0AC34G5A0_9BILA
MAICDIFAFLNGTSDSSLIRYHGTHYLQPTRKNIQKCLQDRRLSGITVVASNDPIAVTSNELSEEQLLSLTSKVNPNIKLNSCPIDTDILTIKTENYRLRNFGIDKFVQDPPNSESECIFSCLIDLANGRLPFNCTSASYNSKTNECTLYSGGSNVNGNGHLIEEANFEHYEKVCAD